MLITDLFKLNEEKTLREPLKLLRECKKFFDGLEDPSAKREVV
jgi:hypothetical protein